MNPDKLALIILNYNSFEDTSECVDLLLSFAGDYRIVVVDNHSSDDSFERLKTGYADKSNVDLIASDTNGGYGAGNNIGIRFAMDTYEADTVGIINPDVRIPDVKVIEGLYRILHEDKTAAIAGGRITERDGSYNLNHSGWDVPSLKELISFHLLNSRRFDKKAEWECIGDDLYRVGCVAGCFFLAKTEFLERIGLFDENMFLYFEETYLGIRCRELGYREIIATDLAYYHDHKAPDNDRLTFKAKVSITKPSYESAKYLIKRYYSPAGLPVLWLAEIYNRSILALSYIKHRIKG